MCDLVAIAMGQNWNWLCQGRALSGTVCWGVAVALGGDQRPNRS